MRRALRTFALGSTLSLILLAAILVLYWYFFVPPVWPKLVGTIDQCSFHGPMAHHLDTVLHEGEFPFWNPLSFCGTPFSANPQTLAFYPPNLVRSALTFDPTPLKTTIGLTVLIVLHLIFAGLCTLALAREYGLSYGAGFVSAFAYIFGPYMVWRAFEQWPLVAVSAWLPLLLLLVRRAVRAESGRDKLFYACASAMAFAMSTLAGFPQLTYYSAITIAVFCIFERLLNGSRRDLGALGKNLMKDAGVLAVTFGLAAFLASAMLLPCIEFIQNSPRARGNELTVIEYPQDVSPRHLLESMLVYPGLTATQQGPRAAGLVVIVLALMGLTHSRRRDVILYAGLFYVLIDCTIGSVLPIGRFLEWADIFRFGSPWRAGVLAGLPLAMLAGFGTDAAAASLKTPFRDTLRSLAIGTAGMVLVILLSQRLQGDVYVYVTNIFVYIPAVAIIVLAIGTPRSYGRAWNILAPLFVFIEIFAWNASFIPSWAGARGFVAPISSLDGGAGTWQDNVRGAERLPNNHLYKRTAAMNGYDTLYIGPVRQVLCDPVREKAYRRIMYDYEPTARTHRGNLFLKRSFWLAKQYVNAPLPGKHDLFPSATTVFLRDPPQLPLPEHERESVGHHSVSENTEKIPVADSRYLAARLKSYGSGKGSMALQFENVSLPGRHSALYLPYTATGKLDVLPLFYDGQSDRREYGLRTIIECGRGQSGVIELPLPDFEVVRIRLGFQRARIGQALKFDEAYILSDKDDENGLIEIVHRGSNSVDLTVHDLPGHRVLTFVDGAYPGWEAYVDSKPTAIMLANDAFKAILIPPGTHQIRFAFVPRVQYAGIGISLASIFLSCIALLLFRPRRAKALE